MHLDTLTRNDRSRRYESSLPAALNKFARHVIVSLLEQMKKGRLDLQLPEGSRLTFGDHDLPSDAVVCVNSEDVEA